MKVLVTTGATVAFEGVIRAVLSETVLSSLVESGYDQLVVQYGHAKSLFEELKSDKNPIQVTGFDFTMEIASEIESSDLVISHAGTGSILDCLTAKKPLIVVVNTDLMDNHQLEIANAFKRGDHLIVSTAQNEQLAGAIKEAGHFNFKPLKQSDGSQVARILYRESGMEI